MLKKSIHTLLNTGTLPSVQRLLKLATRYSYISFDIFDTLLKRNIPNPNDLFEIIEHQLSNEFGPFKQNRISAERTARSVSSKEDIRLDEIYEYYPGLSESDKQSLISIELETEKRVLIPNQKIIDFYNQCLQSGKKIFLVSDMYLPIEFVQGILFDAGIHHYSALYLSSDQQKTKFTGSLFKALLKEQSLQPKELIHIGDSWRSGFVIPCVLGIKSIHIPRIVKRSHYQLISDKPDISVKCLNAFINNSLPENPNPYFRFGYEKFGMFLWGYARWLLFSVKKKGIDRLYFFSRDGLIMKKAVDICNTDPALKTYYLEVSRRSLRVPVLWKDCNLKTVLDLLPPFDHMPIHSLFDGVGLDIERYQHVLTKYGFDQNTVFARRSILKNQPLTKLFEALQPKIIENSKREYAQLRRYISQNHLSGRFAVVDIGWAGSIQRYLMQTLNTLDIAYDITGYYIGIDESYKRHVDAVKSFDVNGYLFDFSKNRDNQDMKKYFVDLLEMLFLEQDGSVKSYKTDENSDRIIAERYPYEYIQNGEQTIEYQNIGHIQQGALKFIENASKDDVLNQFHYTAEMLFNGIYQTGMAPRKADLNLFADFYFIEENVKQRLAAPQHILYYVFHWRQLMKDFFASGWKAGFVKRLIKISLPYEKIFNKLMDLVR